MDREIRNAGARVRGAETRVLFASLLAALVSLTGCADGDDPVMTQLSKPGAQAAAGTALSEQRDLVEQLRTAHGDGDPRTLAAMAQWIRLAVLTGDLASGTPIFDRLLDLDLRTSPVLAYGKPPITLARDLGGLGELKAACWRLADALPKSAKILEVDNPFILEAERALARLQLALGENSEAIARLERILEVRRRSLGAENGATRAADRDLRQARRQGSGADDRGRTRETPSRLGEMPGLGSPVPQIDYSEREARWRPTGDDLIAASSFDHAHFDHILELSAKAGLEVAERFRLSAWQDLSLVTRIRRHGASGKPVEPLPEGVLEYRQRPPRGGPPAVGPELEAITLQIQAVTRILDGMPSSDARFASLLDERERLQGKRRDLLNQTWESVEEVYIPTYLSDLQPYLDPSSRMLYFVVGADHTDLLVVPPTGGVSSHRLPAGSDELAAAVGHLLSSPGLQTRRGVAVVEDETVEPQASRELGRELFDVLIAPAAKEIEAAERLVIVGDGPLNKLPFSALRRTGADGAEQYLAEWKILHFAPSAAAYQALVERRKRRTGEPLAGSLVAFANPAYDRVSPAGKEQTMPVAVRSAAARGFSGRFDSLPGSEREAKQIGRLFDERSLDAEVLLGSSASEDLVKKRAADAAFLHFAVHGFNDDVQSEHSFLVLSLPPALAEGQENGILEGWEIVDDLRLDAELVVLSACETALGRERSGEGPVSLGRAFLAAGAHSVLASLWQVDDAATAELMISFYRHLLAGNPKDEALRLAQLELLKNPKLGFQAPYHWAGFQLTGDWL